MVGNVLHDRTLAAAGVLVCVLDTHLFAGLAIGATLGSTWAASDFSVVLSDLSDNVKKCVLNVDA